MSKQEDIQMNQVAGMMMSMVKPMIKQSYGKPESEAVKDQVDIMASAIVRMFPGLTVLIDADDVKGLMYNMKQKDLDEFYETVELALGARK